MVTSSSMPAKLQKLAPTRIFEQAVEQIRELISSGALAPAEKLPPEQELCKQLGVSRSSVREALRVLEAEGLVEIRRGSGTYISSHPALRNRRGEVMRWLAQREEAIDQVLQVRESIETLTASLVAAACSPETLAEIRSIVAEQVKMSQQLNAGREADLDTLAHLDELFHLAISDASGNDIAHEIITHIIPAFNEGNKAILFLGRHNGRMAVEHQRILAALEAHDPAAAAEAMRIHIQQVRNEILALQPGQAAQTE